MKIKLLAIVLCLMALLCLVTLTACDKDTDCAHSNKEWVEEISATCTANGTLAHYVCKDCNQTLDDKGTVIVSLTIPAAHSPESKWSFADGKHYRACENCDAKFDEAACSGGTATCTEKAKCSVCENEYGAEPAHSPKTEWSVADGKHYHACNNCDAKLDEAACSGGTATCTEKAECSVCHNKYGSTDDHVYSVTKYDDDYHWQQCTCTAKNELVAHSYTRTEVTQPTCNEGGYTTYYCECGHFYIDDETSASGHKYDETKWTWGDGYHWHAAICGCEGERKDYATHVLVAEVTEPTCTSNGYTVYRCDCGYVSDPTEVVPASGHTVNVWTETSSTISDATKCEYTVIYSGTCTVCNNDDTKSEKLPRHSLYEKTVISATCKEEGQKSKFCSSEECMYHTVAYDTYGYTDSEAHVWVEGRTTDTTTVYKCQLCDATKTQSSGNSANISGSDLKDTSEIEFANPNGGANGNIVIGIDKDIKDNFGDQDISISAGTLDEAEKQAAMEKTELTEEQKAMLDGCDIFDFTLSADNFDGKLGGMATIRVPYTLKPGENPNSIIVWYIDKGELTPIEAVYAVDVNGNGYVTFQTDHFSYYTVGSIDPAEICEKLEKHDADHQHIIAPTCTTGGYTICLRCGKQVEESATPALGHHFEIQVIKEAGCATNGLARHTCADCDMTYEVVIPATGHYYTPIEQITATCKSAGSVTYKCTHCDDTYTATTPQLAHTYHAYVVAPTCDTNGYTEKTCSACGDVVRMSVTPATGHVESTEWYNDNANHYHICISCGEKMSEAAHVPGPAATEQTAQICTVCEYTINPPTQHVHSLTKVDAVKPDCTNGGNIEYYVCKCGVWFADADGKSVIADHSSVILTANGHNAQSTPYVAPTCEKEGYTAGVWCDDCKTYLRGHVVIPAYGHDYNKIEVAPTCTENGSITYSCANCGDTNGKPGVLIDALGHAWGEWKEGPTIGMHTRVCSHDESHVETEKCNNVAEVVAPTCDAEGYKKYTCEDCGHSYTTDYVKAHGHEYGEWTYVDDNQHQRVCKYDETHVEIEKCDVETVRVEPDCDKEGSETYTCKTCGHTDTVGIPAYPHEYGDEWIYVEDTTQANSHQHVKVCKNNPEHKLVESCDLIGRIFEADCTNDGYTEYTCSACKHSFITDETKAHGHEYGEWTYVDDNQHQRVCKYDETHFEIEKCDIETVRVEPDCDKEGSETYTCKTCGHTDTVGIPAYPHEYGDEWIYVEDTTQANSHQHVKVCKNNPEHKLVEACDLIGRIFEADCTNDGYTEYVCSACKHSFITDEVKAPGHVYVDGVCQGCGRNEDQVDEDYRFATNTRLSQRRNAVARITKLTSEQEMELKRLLSIVGSTSSAKELDEAAAAHDKIIDEIVSTFSELDKTRFNSLSEMRIRWYMLRRELQNIGIQIGQDYLNKYNDLTNQMVNAQSEEEILSCFEAYVEFEEIVRNDLENIDQKRYEAFAAMNERWNSFVEKYGYNESAQMEYNNWYELVANAQTCEMIETYYGQFVGWIEELESAYKPVVDEELRQKILNNMKAGFDTIKENGWTTTDEQMAYLEIIYSNVDTADSNDVLKELWSKFESTLKKIEKDNSGSSVDPEFREGILRKMDNIWNDYASKNGDQHYQEYIENWYNKVKDANSAKDIDNIFYQFEKWIQKLQSSGTVDEAYRMSIINQMNDRWVAAQDKLTPSVLEANRAYLMMLIDNVKTATSMSEINDLWNKFNEKMNQMEQSGEVSPEYRESILNKMERVWNDYAEKNGDQYYQEFVDIWYNKVKVAITEKEIDSLYSKFKTWINELPTSDSELVDEALRTNVMHDMEYRWIEISGKYALDESVHEKYQDYCNAVGNAKSNDEIYKIYDEFKNWANEIENSFGNGEDIALKAYRASRLQEMKNRWTEFVANFISNGGENLEEHQQNYNRWVSRVEKASSIDEIDMLMRDFNTWIKNLESGYYPDEPSVRVEKFYVEVGSLNAQVGDDVEKLIENNIIGKQFVFKYTDGTEQRIAITRDMIFIYFTDNVFVNEGMYTFDIQAILEGSVYVCGVTVEVRPNMDNATVIGEYTVDPSTPGVTGEWKVVLYDNGYAVMMVVGGGSELGTYHMENGLLYIMSGGSELVMKIHEETKTVTFYNPKGELNLIGTYNYYDTMIQVYGDYHGHDTYIAVFTMMGDGGQPIYLTSTVMLDLENRILSGGMFGGDLYFDDEGNLSDRNPSEECMHEIIIDSMAPTCTTEGYHKEYCVRCGMMVMDMVMVKLPHELGADGVCIMCGNQNGGNDSSVRDVTLENMHNEWSMLFDELYGDVAYEYVKRFDELIERVEHAKNDDEITRIYKVEFRKLINEVRDSQPDYVEHLYLENTHFELPGDHGHQMKDFIEKYVIGTSICIVYSKGETVRVPIDWYMINYYGEDISTPGTYRIEVHYDGENFGIHDTITLEVLVDFGSANLIGSYYCDMSCMQQSAVTLEVYDNGYVKIIGDGYEEVAQGNLNGDKLFVTAGNNSQLVFIIVDEKTAEMYDGHKNGENVIGSYMDKNSGLCITVFGEYNGFGGYIAMVSNGAGSWYAAMVDFDMENRTIYCGLLRNEILSFDENGNLLFPEEEGCNHVPTVDRCEPTCTEDGYYKEFCMNCGEIFGYELYPATGHHMSMDGICINCGWSDGGNVGEDDLSSLRQELLNRMDMEWNELIGEVGTVERDYVLQYNSIVKRIRIEQDAEVMIRLYKIEFCELLQKIRESNENADYFMHVYLEQRYFELEANHGLDIHSFIEKYVIGTNLCVVYSQSGVTMIPIDWSMIQYDKDLDISGHGTYHIRVTYGNGDWWTDQSVEINVLMDMSNTKLIGTYFCDLSCMDEGSVTLEIYDNGYAIVIFEGGDYREFYPCHVENDMIFWDTDGDGVYVFVIKDDKTAEMYDGFKYGDPIIGEFRIDDEDMTITVFGEYNGKGTYLARFSERYEDNEYWMTMTVQFDLEARMIYCEMFGDEPLYFDETGNYIDPDGDECKHNEVMVGESQSTCTEHGHITQICTKCGMVLIDEILPMLPHALDMNGVCMNCGLVVGGDVGEDDNSALRKELLNRMDDDWNRLLKEMNGKIELRYQMRYDEIVNRIMMTSDSQFMTDLYKYDFCNLLEEVRGSYVESDRFVRAYLEQEYIELPGDHGYEMHDFIEKYIIGTNLYIEYAQSGVKAIPIDWSMVSYDECDDISCHGTYHIWINYGEGNFWIQQSIELTVLMDMTGVTHIGTYTCDLSSMGEDIIALFEIYDNGYARVSLDGGKSYDYQNCYVEGDKVFWGMNGEIVLVIKGENTLEIYDLLESGEAVIGEYRYEEHYLGVTVFGEYTGAGRYLARLFDTSGDGYWLTMTVYLDLENSMIASEFLGSHPFTIGADGNLIPQKVEEDQPNYGEEDMPDYDYGENTKPEYGEVVVPGYPTVDGEGKVEFDTTVNGSYNDSYVIVGGNMGYIQTQNGVYGNYVAYIA